MSECFLPGVHVHLGYVGSFQGVCKHPWQVCIIRWKRSGLHITSKTDLICDVRFTGRQYSVCNFSLTLYIRTILFSPDKIVDTVAIKFLQCCVLFSERISFLPRGSCPCHVYSGVISEKKKGVKPCSTWWPKVDLKAQLCQEGQDTFIIHT